MLFIDLYLYEKNLHGCPSGVNMNPSTFFKNKLNNQQLS